MAAGLLPKPGTKVGPCKSRCRHLDCEQTKTDAATQCRFCFQAIGYETRYVRARFDSCLAHEVCLEEAVQRNDARVGLF